MLPAAVRPPVGARAPSAWRRLLGGEGDPRAAIAELGRRLRRRFRLRPRDAACRGMRGEIARLAADGAQIRILVGRNAAALDGLEEDFGLQGRWLARQRGVDVAVIRDLDQRLWSQQSQDLALDEMYRFLGVDAAQGAAGAARGTTGVAPSTNRQAAV